ncbi:hypothetical protein ACA910_021358 [Epithemia clementina (nom. ined.)]
MTDDNNASFLSFQLPPLNPTTKKKEHDRYTGYDNSPRSPSKQLTLKSSIAKRNSKARSERSNEISRDIYRPSIVPTIITDSAPTAMTTKQVAQANGDETGASNHNENHPTQVSTIATSETDHLLSSPPSLVTTSVAAVAPVPAATNPFVYFSFGAPSLRSVTSSVRGSSQHEEDNYYKDTDATLNEITHGTSTIWGCAVNVINAIMGAGCIGYGGAMAQSGGFIFIALITIFAILMKYSFDLLVELVLLLPSSRGHNNNNNRRSSYSSSAASTAASYEALAIQSGYGRIGLWTVMASKGFYSLGCMVAYIVIIKDNLASGCRGLVPSLWLHWFGWSSSTSNAAISTPTQITFWMNNANSDVLATLVVCLTVMLPLCLLRNVSLLERFSSAKIFMYGVILAIVGYLFTTLPTPPLHDQLSFYDKWWRVKTPDIFQNMGTIVLSFEAAQNIHILFRSLQPQHGNLRDWSRVTTISISFSYVAFLGLALFTYMTFWDQTTSDLFLQYPQNIAVVSVARVFLSISMLFTYPMPLFALREIVLLCADAVLMRRLRRQCIKEMCDVMASSIETPYTEDEEEEHDSFPNSSTTGVDTFDSQAAAYPSTTSLGHWKTTRWLKHVVLTVALVAASMILAMSGASLGQILNLIGCVSGTLISFILPAVFSFRLQGVTPLGIIFMIVGSFVGIVDGVYILSSGFAVCFGLPFAQKLVSFLLFPVVKFIAGCSSLIRLSSSQI